ncbi:hypothetical protein [Archangium sp.]|jgi:hypothetical protein|uniref:hypothetical protein n=1 Tax=Archangium sp. TaxID=1872627 RepID=UPI002EDB590C
MTRTKLLLTGLLAGAVAFGTACKTDKGNTNTGTGTGTDTMATDAGMGGAGYDNPDHSRMGDNPVPEEGMREMEPGVHEGNTVEEPGTGGTGLEPEPIDRTDRMGGETGEEPLNPGAPANTDDPMPHDDGMRAPKQ